MADLEIVHRRSLTWLWWVVGVAVVAAILWFAARNVGGKAADLRDNPEAPPPEPAPEPQTLHRSPDPSPARWALRAEADARHRT